MTTPVFQQSTSFFDVSSAPNTGLIPLQSDPAGPLRPQPCRPFTAATPAEQRRFAQAVERRARRLERVKSLKPSLSS